MGDHRELDRRGGGPSSAGRIGACGNEVEQDDCRQSSVRPIPQPLARTKRNNQTPSGRERGSERSGAGEGSRGGTTAFGGRATKDIG